MYDTDIDSLIKSQKGDVGSYTTKKTTTPEPTQHSSGSSSVAGWISLASDNLSQSTDGNLSLGNISNENGHTSLHRHLTLPDLISIGVAATVGSGIFVLCGLIAHDYAGPATFFCWGIAGVSCALSGVCYAELSGKMAVSGGTYTYVKLTMGELPSVIAGACLTLEYIIAASAVARSWGDKVVALIVSYLGDDAEETKMILKIFDPGYSLNPMAFLISSAAVILLLKGVQESKKVTNFFTALKVVLIAFMSIVALCLFKKENFFPILPAQFGVAGILRGSSSSFFGYIGFDEICCMGSEVVDPTRNLPRAVMGTIALVTVLYTVAAIGLVGMVPYEHISVTSGFPEGFRYRGHEVIAVISALGEIVSLPIVVLVTTMAQPRLQYAMAEDGLLPQIFLKIDETGNLWHGTFIAGIGMIIVATCVPFTYLNNLISSGVLIAFSMTAASVILTRHRSPRDQPLLLEKSLAKFNVLSFTMGLLLQMGGSDLTAQLLPLLNLLMLVGLAMKIATTCPALESKEGYFEAPFVPYLPLLTQFLNWYLIGQLGLFSILLLASYLGVTLILYFTFKEEKPLSKGGENNSDCSIDSLGSQLSMAPMIQA